MSFLFRTRKNVTSVHLKIIYWNQRVSDQYSEDIDTVYTLPELASYKLPASSAASQSTLNTGPHPEGSLLRGDGRADKADRQYTECPTAPRQSEGRE